MFKIEFDVKLNDDGIPYIDLTDKYIDYPEMKFFVMEVTRYLLYEIIKKNTENKGRLSNDTLNKLSEAGQVIEEISVEMGKLLKGQMEAYSEIENLLKPKIYDLVVDKVEKLYKFNPEGFILNGKIFKYQKGLKALVSEDNCVYEFQGGRDYKNWKKEE